MHALLHAIIGGCGVDLPKSGVAMADRLPSLAWPTLAKKEEGLVKCLYYVRTGESESDCPSKNANAGDKIN